MQRVPAKGGRPHMYSDLEIVLRYVLSSTGTVYIRITWFAIQQGVRADPDRSAAGDLLVRQRSRYTSSFRGTALCAAFKPPPIDVAVDPDERSAFWQLLHPRMSCNRTRTVPVHCLRSALRVVGFHDPAMSQLSSCLEWLRAWPTGF